MRIAVLNWRDQSHPRAGGAELFVHEVGRRWVREGHQVRLVTSRYPGSSRVADDGGMEILRVGRLATGLHHALAPRAALRFRPDVVLESVNTIPYWLPVRVRDVPVTTLVHQLARDVWASHLPGRIATIAERIERGFFRPYRSAQLLAVSDSTRFDLHDFGVKEVTVLPQGGLGAQRTYQKAAVPTVVFVGRLSANKRPDHALEAFRLLRTELSDAKLWMIGEGPLRGRLLERLPEGTELLGRVSRDELLERMGKAHLLFATSVREGWGLVVTEANSVGTPAIAYNVPGLRDSIRAGVTGVLTDSSPGALSDAAVNLLRDDKRYATMTRAAIEWGSSHSWDRTAAELADHLRGLLEAPPTRAGS